MLIFSPSRISIQFEKWSFQDYNKKPSNHLFSRPYMEMTMQYIYRFFVTVIVPDVLLRKQLPLGHAAQYLRSASTVPEDKFGLILLWCSRIETHINGATG